MTETEKKRKRHEEGHDGPDGPPSKRIATERPPHSIIVSVIEDGDEWVPVLGEHIELLLLCWY